MHMHVLVCTCAWACMYIYATCAETMRIEISSLLNRLLRYEVGGHLYAYKFYGLVGQTYCVQCVPTFSYTYIITYANLLYNERCECALRNIFTLRVLFIHKTENNKMRKLSVWYTIIISWDLLYQSWLIVIKSPWHNIRKVPLNFWLFLILII